MFDLGEAYPEAYPLKTLLLYIVLLITLVFTLCEAYLEAYLRSIPHSQTSRPRNVNKNTKPFGHFIYKTRSKGQTFCTVGGCKFMTKFVKRNSKIHALGANSNRRSAYIVGPKGWKSSLQVFFQDRQ